MPNFNKTILMGNLTREPELRVTPRGTSVCAFGMAVNRVFSDESGEKREETTFLDCEAWGRQAEIISKYVSKGNPLFVEGRLRLDTWESKAGEKRSKLKVVVENMQLMGSRGDGGSRSPEEHAPAARKSAPAASKSPAPAASGEDIEEDVPF